MKYKLSVTFFSPFFYQIAWGGVELRCILVPWQKFKIWKCFNYFFFFCSFWRSKIMWIFLFPFSRFACTKIENTVSACMKSANSSINTFLAHEHLPTWKWLPLSSSSNPSIFKIIIVQIVGSINKSPAVLPFQISQLCSRFRT